MSASLILGLTLLAAGAVTPSSALAASCPAAPAGPPPATPPVRWVDTADRAGMVGVVELGVATSRIPPPDAPRWGDGVHAMAVVDRSVVVVWQCAAQVRRRSCDPSDRRGDLGCDPVMSVGPLCTGKPGLHVESLSLRSGRTQWRKMLAGPTFAVVGRSALARASDGSFYLAGHFSGAFGVEGHAAAAARGGIGTWVLKLDAAGRVAWLREAGGPYAINYLGPVLAPDETGGVFVALQTGPADRQPPAADTDVRNDIAVQAFDRAGRVRWTHRIGGPGVRHEPTGLAPTAGGAVVLGGNLEIPSGTGTCAGAGREGGFVEKLDAAGRSQWRIRLPSSVSALTNAPGGVLVTGAVWDAGQGPAGSGPILARVTDAGELDWIGPLCAFAGESYSDVEARSVWWPRAMLAGMCMGPSAVAPTVPPRRFILEGTGSRR